MLDRLCVGPMIEKTRYRVSHGGKIWDVDVFAGQDQPLRPAGKGVTDDPRFRNSAIVLLPMAELAV